MPRFQHRRTRELLSPGVGGATAVDDGLLSAVREAVADQRFHLFYQPIVQLSTRQPVGCEAFLRWDADVGRLSPATFLPALRATGLLADVGRWALAESTQTALRAWGDRSDRFLCLNVGAEEVVPGYAARVLEILSLAGFPPERLCLELTDAARFPDPAGAWRELRVLKAQGVRLFIDDFGTAGSSMADLKQFSVDAVKIDGSFVHGLGAVGEDDAIVAAVVKLAHALGMRSIAEAVETEDQVARLSALGCDLGQGYLFGSPGPAMPGAH